MFINTDGVFTFGNIPLSQNDYETNKRVNDIIKRSREAAKSIIDLKLCFSSSSRTPEIH